jgi:hypothetical protein
MPRKSAAALAVVARTVDHRPPPPAELTPAQVVTWETIVRRMPHDWFPAETHPALTALCRHIDTATQLATVIDKFEVDWIGEEGGLERLNSLLKLRDREHRAIVTISRSLRLTNQSRYPADKASRMAAKPTFAAGMAPWEKHASADSPGNWGYIA